MEERRQAQGSRDVDAAEKHGVVTTKLGRSEERARWTAVALVVKERSQGAGVLGVGDGGHWMPDRRIRGVGHVGGDEDCFEQQNLCRNIHTCIGLGVCLWVDE
jgi:hypothetical protein